MKTANTRQASLFISVVFFFLFNSNVFAENDDLLLFSVPTITAVLATCNSPDITKCRIPQRCEELGGLFFQGSCLVKYSLTYAIDNQLSDVQVKDSGIVSKTLSDDLNGSRHQRFILRLEDNHTLLVAHNIDLAPKIKSLRKGDRVNFYGEYEWNNKGGVLHWTHHDPGGHHIDGWLEHEGKRYQ